MDELQKLSKENQTQQVILDCIDLDRRDRFVDIESRVTLSWTLKPVRHEWKNLISAANEIEAMADIF